MGRDEVSLQGQGTLRLAGEGFTQENTAVDWGGMCEGEGICVPVPPLAGSMLKVLAAAVSPLWRPWGRQKGFI